MTCKVLAVIGARLNSSRLPAKHLLDLAGKPLIERLFERLERVPGLDRIILATTADAFNQPLVDWARASNRGWYAFPGDVNDLMGRVDEVVRAQNPEIVFYICGDSPLVEPDLLGRMISALRAHPEAHCVGIEARQRKVIHQGIHCYPIDTWNMLIAASQTPSEREHVGSAWPKIGAGLKGINLAEAPIFYALDHRLSVDTPSDYRFMSTIYRRWYANHPPTQIVSLTWVIERLLAEPALRAINATVKQKAIGDRSLPVLLLTAVGPQVGLGHLRRMLVLARALQDHQAAGVRLLICGEPLSRPELGLLPHRFCSDPISGLRVEKEQRSIEALVCDMPASLVTPEFTAMLQQEGSYLVSIDFTLPKAAKLDLQWVPSFYLDPGAAKKPHLRFGWDCFLLDRPQTPRDWSAEMEVVVLTGAADGQAFGQTLPDLLETLLPEQAQITWVRGPFAAEPKIPARSRRWTLVENPEEPGALMDRARFAIATYGVSFFECLSRGLATVVITPDRADPEFMALEEKGVAQRAVTAREAAEKMAALLKRPSLAGDLAHQARTCLDGLGPKRLAEIIVAGAVREPK